MRREGLTDTSKTLKPGDRLRKALEADVRRKSSVIQVKPSALAAKLVNIQKGLVVAEQRGKGVENLCQQYGFEDPDELRSAIKQLEIVISPDLTLRERQLAFERSSLE